MNTTTSIGPGSRGGTVPVATVLRLQPPTQTLLFERRCNVAMGFLPEPGKIANGEEIGPCVEVCDHVDCEQTRAMALTRCHYCGLTIGYETGFVNHDVGGDKKLCHAACVSQEEHRYVRMPSDPVGEAKARKHANYGK